MLMLVLGWLFLVGWLMLVCWFTVGAFMLLQVDWLVHRRVVLAATSRLAYDAW